jgi:hypothetical protein
LRSLRLKRANKRERKCKIGAWDGKATCDATSGVYERKLMTNKVLVLCVQVEMLKITSQDFRENSKQRTIAGIFGNAFFWILEILKSSFV